MDGNRKRELLESFCEQMGILHNEMKEERTEYIASSNTLKVNYAAQVNKNEKETIKEETIEDKLRKVVNVYKTRTTMP